MNSSKRVQIVFLLISILFIFACATIRTARTLTIPLNTYPEGATIFLDGVNFGKTPNDLKITYIDLAEGFHNSKIMARKLEIKKDHYKPYIFSFTIKDKTYKKIPDIIVLESLLADLVSITGAAGALEKLTTGKANAKVLDLSSDSKSLLIESFGKDKNTNHMLQKFNLTEGTFTLLTNLSSDNREGMWLPDKSGVIFSTKRLGVSTIVQSLGIAGEVGVRFITNPSLGNAHNPAISPDGQDIVFSFENSNMESQIAIIKKDGTTLRMFGSGIQPAWSPDGKQIVFIGDAGKYKHIFKMDASNGANLIGLTSIEANNHSPVYSPSGKYIAFISNRIGYWNHLFIMTANGHDVTQITDGFFDVNSIVWGNDGYIYFSANAGGDLNIWRLKPNIQ